MKRRGSGGGRRPGRPQQPQGSQPQGELRWLGGVHSVEETLRAKPGTVRELWVEHEQNAPSIKDIIGLARRHGIKVQFMGRPELDRAVHGGRHQGVAIKVFLEAGEGFGTFLRNLAPEDKTGLVLVAVDELQDPHNLGAIARSALNLGAKGLILPDRRTCPVTPTAITASAGALQKIKVYEVVNLGHALERCRDEGFWIYGADAAGKTCWDVKVSTPMVLVIGSEGYGLRPTTQKLCHELLSIPQAKGGVESLNASCAASVLMYEIARQLGGPA